MAERMIRKQIYIEPRQEAGLKEMSVRLGVAESSLIRRGIDIALQAAPSGFWQPEVWERELEFARGMTATDLPRQWTRDELYDR
jgi:hypothetical protein